MNLHKNKDSVSPAHALLKELKEKFQVFANSMPLAIGIDKQVFERLPEIDRKLLRVALGIHTKSNQYLRNAAKATARFDLDGNAVSEVLESHRTHAQGVLKQRAKQADERRLLLRKEQQEAEEAEAARKRSESLNSLVAKFSKNAR
jgi:ProP effector